MRPARHSDVSKSTEAFDALNALQTCMTLQQPQVETHGSRCITHLSQNLQFNVFPCPFHPFIIFHDPIAATSGADLALSLLSVAASPTIVRGLNLGVLAESSSCSCPTSSGDTSG